jgi:hypothetical protein
VCDKLQELVGDWIELIPLPLDHTGYANIQGVTNYWTEPNRRNNRFIRYFLDAGADGLDEDERRRARTESGVGSIGGWFVTAKQPNGFLEWIEPQRTHARLTADGLFMARENLAAEREDRKPGSLEELKGIPVVHTMKSSATQSGDEAIPLYLGTALITAPYYLKLEGSAPWDYVEEWDANTWDEVSDVIRDSLADPEMLSLRETWQRKALDVAHRKVMAALVPEQGGKTIIEHAVDEDHEAARRVTVTVRQRVGL